MEDKKFITGLFTKKPSPKAPSFLKAKVSIKKQDFIGWLEQQDSEWVNIDILESQKGEFYGKVDDWKPTAQGNQEAPQDSGFNQIDPDIIDENSIPF